MSALDSTPTHLDAPQQRLDTSAAHLSVEANSYHAPTAAPRIGDTAGQQQALDNGLGPGTSSIYSSPETAPAAPGLSSRPVSEAQIKDINNGLAQTASLYNQEGGQTSRPGISNGETIAHGRDTTGPGAVSSGPADGSQPQTSDKQGASDHNSGPAPGDSQISGGISPSPPDSQTHTAHGGETPLPGNNFSPDAGGDAQAGSLSSNSGESSLPATIGPAAPGGELSPSPAPGPHEISPATAVDTKQTTVGGGTAGTVGDTRTVAPGGNAGSALSDNTVPAPGPAPSSAADITVTPAHDTTVTPAHDTTVTPAHDTTVTPAHDTTVIPAHDTTFRPAGDAAVIASSDAHVPHTDATTAAPESANQEVARQILARAAEAEKTVTPDLQRLAQATGGQLTGLEHKLKTQESLERKLDKPTAPERISDALRYTINFPPESLTQGAKTVMGQLKAEGYQPQKVGNTFPYDDAPYRGLNTTFSTNGQTFELQFHTPESHDIKEKNHTLYEVGRLLFHTDPADPNKEVLNSTAKNAEILSGKEGDKLAQYPQLAALAKQLIQNQGDEAGGQALARQLVGAIDDQQVANYDGYQVPDNIDSIKDFRPY